MFVIEKMRLNDFKQVHIPQRRLMYERFAGRVVSDYNRVPTAEDLPDNLQGNILDDYRVGKAILDYEEHKHMLNEEAKRLQLTENQLVKNKEEE